MHVNLWDYTGEGRIIAVIRAENGQMQIEGKVPTRIVGDLENAHKRKPEDGAFLRWLPMVFSGTYIRAQFVAD